MIGESTMLSFSPAPPLKSSSAWAMDKLGSKVDPEDVIDGCVLSLVALANCLLAC